VNLALWKKSFHESKWPLLAASIALCAFCWIRIWISSQIEIDRFAEIVQLLWPEWKKFSSVPLSHILTHPGRLAVTYNEPLLLMIVSGWAITRGSDVVSGELGRGTMELLLAQPISRLQILVTQASVLVLGTAILAGSTWSGMWLGIQQTVVTPSNQPVSIKLPLLPLEVPLPIPRSDPEPVAMSELVDPSLYIPAAGNLFALGIFLAGLTTFLSSWDSLRWRTIGLAVSFWVIQLVLWMLSRTVESCRWLEQITFFGVYRPEQAVYLAVEHPEQVWHWFLYDPAGKWVGLAPLGSMALLIGLGACGFIAAGIIFNRRDLPVGT